MMVLAVVIFLCLLLGLGIGLFILRRVLLPDIKVKMPSGGTTSWTRDGVPDPDNVGDQRMN